MEMEKIIRTWKDEDYRLSLSIEEQRSLPANPAGMIEISQTDLNDVAEGRTFYTSAVFICVFPPYC
jgi:mersacidin/lichenicidin family type 2 lantibiotic